MDCFDRCHAGVSCPLQPAGIAALAQAVDCPLATTKRNARHSGPAHVAATRAGPARYSQPSNQTQAFASSNPYLDPHICTIQRRSVASNVLVVALAEGLTSSRCGRARLRNDLRCPGQAPPAVGLLLCVSLVRPLLREPAMLAPSHLPKEKRHSGARLGLGRT